MKQSNKYSFRFIINGFVMMLLLNQVNPLQAGIHKCISENGIEYSDTHCSAGVLVKHAPGYRALNSIDGLTQHELEVLYEMEKAYRKSRVQADRYSSAHTKKLHRERARKRQDHARSCARAIKGLEKLRIIKRKGYSAKQSRVLDSREDLLNEQKRENC